jgi:glycosyltransferase involved in cell wall biosynthesis
VYNAEKYLEECVRSVLAQKNCGAFELILINDGSKDSSAAICDGLAQQDERIHVIHQKNQGVSVARNKGIAAAQGRFILFLDSDDLWDAALLETLEKHLQQEPDMIAFGYSQFGCCTDLEEFIPVENGQCETGLDYFGRYEKIGRMPAVSCWATAFRRQFLLDSANQFPLNVKYGEDFRFYMHCLKAAKGLVAIPCSLYRYRVNEESVTHTPTVDKMRDVLEACVDMYHLIPCSMLADYYCMNILSLADFSRKEAAALFAYLNENRHVLRHVAGKKLRVARLLYHVFGWYGAARLVRIAVNIRHGEI